MVNCFITPTRRHKTNRYCFFIRAETTVVYLMHSSVRFLLKQYKHMSTFIRVGQTELAGNLEIKQNTPLCMCNRV
jgi:hypothetical protein